MISLFSGMRSILLRILLLNMDFCINSELTGEWSPTSENVDKKMLANKGLPKLKYELPVH